MNSRNIFTRFFIHAVVLMITMVGFASCASSSKTATSNSDSATADNTTEQKASDRLSVEELEKLYYARKKSDLSKFVQADVDFMVGMIGHHAQALVMSRLAPENGANGSVQILASRIINAQNDEIAAMQRWLEERGQVVPQIHIEGLILTIHGGDDHMNMGHGDMEGMDNTMMPGMLTQLQLNELGEARGVEFDRLFLTYMIDHHSGAVFMVDELFKVDGAGQGDAVFKLASDIQVDQRTEIARMRRMLSNLAQAQ